MTTFEQDDDQNDPSLIIHVPKDETEPEKHNRTIFWFGLLILMMIIGLGSGLGFGYMINDSDEIGIAPPPSTQNEMIRHFSKQFSFLTILTLSQKCILVSHSTMG